MNEHTTLRGGDEGYGNSRGLTRQGPLELPYVRISSWALNPSSCDSTLKESESLTMLPFLAISDPSSVATLPPLGRTLVPQGVLVCYLVP